MNHVKKGQAGLTPNILKRKQHKVNWITVFTALLITGLVAGAWTYLGPRTNQAKAYKVLEAREAELTLKLEELNKVQTTTQELQETKTKLEAEKVKLEAELQAKAATKKAYAESLVQASVAVSAPIVGNCADWLVQAGVDDIQSASKLISRESGCNPSARNPSSGAFGIPQALPASKIAHCGTDPVCQIKWMDKYCKDRYGSWANALAHSYSHNWY